MSSIAEKRTQVRQVPALRGPASIVVGPDRIAAFIENASSTGLMIRLPASVDVPPSFTLAIGDFQQNYDLIWRDATHLGARLSS